MASEKGLTQCLLEAQREKSLNWIILDTERKVNVQSEPELPTPWQNFPGN